MSVDEAIAVMTQMIQMSVFVAGPLLGAALVGGVMIGILQTATQINEMSVAYVVKAACVLIVFIFGGTTLAEKTVHYARSQLTAVADVVR